MRLIPPPPRACRKAWSRPPRQEFPRASPRTLRKVWSCLPGTAFPRQASPNRRLEAPLLRQACSRQPYITLPQWAARRQTKNFRPREEPTCLTQREIRCQTKGPNHSIKGPEGGRGHPRRSFASIGLTALLALLECWTRWSALVSEFPTHSTADFAPRENNGQNSVRSDPRCIGGLSPRHPSGRELLRPSEAPRRHRLRQKSALRFEYQPEAYGRFREMNLHRVIALDRGKQG